MQTKIPYGKTALSFVLPNGHEGAIVTSNIDELKAEVSQEQLVKNAMANPFGGKKLSELAVGKKDCVLIISDHTRPVPSRVILPSMLAELRQGNPDIDITLLVATGFHRATTDAELRAKLGDEIFEKEKIVVHDAQDASSNVALGILPSGAPLVIDRLAVETELLVAEGFIEPHFFAGFSGGRKSVLPGVCDAKTVLANHNGGLIDSAFSRTGILENNPIHRDMVEAARMAKLAFICNVVIDEEKNACAAFAGDPFEAHEAGCNFLRGYCSVKAPKGDIVITGNGGAPLDQNIYQCVKSMTAAEAAAKEGAVIILCAECADGTGGDSFYAHMRDCETPALLEREAAATPFDETLPDQWQYQILARILAKHEVIFVTRKEICGIIEDMKMTYAESLDEAIALAVEKKGESAFFTVIPNGISVIVE